METVIGPRNPPAQLYDPDAQAFFDAAGIVDTTQKLAVNQLVINLKLTGIWVKMFAIYPFVGGSSTTHKWNLKDPRDLDVAFRLTFFGGWIHSLTGAKPNVQLFLGGTNNKDLNMSDPTLKESAFAAIGVSLTNTENVDFYNTVQTFQTTLNRNV